MTLKDGKTGMVLKIVKIHESDLKQRMMTMGLIPGTKVTVLRSAPLGDPIAIGVRSYNLARARQMPRGSRSSRSADHGNGTKQQGRCSSMRVGGQKQRKETYFHLCQH